MKENRETIINRGRADYYREAGEEDEIDGFEKGGEYRKKANGVVHADKGKARHMTETVKEIKKAYQQGLKNKNKT